MFHKLDCAAGCCGYDAHSDWSGTLSEKTVHDWLDRHTAAEEYYDEWDGEWKVNEDERPVLPLVFASSVGEDGLDYIVHVASWADAKNWKYILTPKHVNINTGKWVAMLILYPPDAETDWAYVKVVK
jgi:hypothetical protein